MAAPVEQEVRRRFILSTGGSFLSRFRNFLYIDEATVDGFLSGVEGGTYEEVQETVSGRLVVADNADSPLGDSTSEQRRTLRQTPEARFSRLWREISSDADETTLEVSADVLDPVDIWQSGQYETFCKFVGHLEVPMIVSAIAAVDNLENLLQIGQRFGAIPIGGSEDEILQQLKAAKDLVRETLPAVLNIGEGRPKIILPLTMKNSKVPVPRYRGRVTVFGRVVERIEDGEQRDLLEFPVVGAATKLSRQQRRAQERENKEVQKNDLVVDGPALGLSVIAIYE